MNWFLVALVVGLLVLAICALIAYTAQAHHDDLIARALTETGIQPQPAPAPLCHSTGPRGGHYYKGVGNEWVCARCGDTAPRGTPVPFDQELTDQQMREVMDDARRITREAAGGATA